MSTKKPTPMVRCPKCRSGGEDVGLIEYWEGAHMEFYQNTDGTIDPEGVLLSNMDPFKISALCVTCGHRWTLRGIMQIVQLPGHPDYEKYKT